MADTEEATCDYTFRYRTLLRYQVFRLVLRVLRRHFVRISIGILIVQIVYIFSKLDVRVTSNGSQARIMQVIAKNSDYNYHYDYEMKHQAVPSRRAMDRPGRAMDRPGRAMDRPGRALDRPGRRNRVLEPIEKSLSKQVAVRYEEDYDHLESNEENHQIVRIPHPDKIVQNPHLDKIVQNPHFDKIVQFAQNNGQKPKTLAPLPANLEIVKIKTPIPKDGKSAVHKLFEVFTPKPHPGDLKSADKDPNIVKVDEGLSMPKSNFKVCNMEERIKHLKHYCNKTNTGDSKPKSFKSGRYAGLVVDEKRKLVLCDTMIPSAAMWLTALVQIQQQTDHGPVNKLSQTLKIRNKEFMNKIGLQYLTKYTKEERSRILREYFKFMVIKHPFDRMVAVWRAKFLNNINQNEKWRKKVGHQIILSKRKIDGKSISEEEIKTSDTARFEEFVEYAFVDRNMQDPSWFSYLQVCHPCEIRYDAILRVETMTEDIEYMYEKFPIFREMSFFGTLEQTEADMRKGKGQIRAFSDVSVTGQEALWTKYVHDFGMFGYTWNMTSNSEGCTVNAEDNTCCC